MHFINLLNYIFIRFDIIHLKTIDFDFRSHLLINNKKKIFNVTGIILFILILIVLVNLALRVLFPSKYFETVIP